MKREIMINKSSITIKDLAQRLGLSTSTVSRALNDSYEISPKTKAAVLKLAKQLNYEPNSLAQGLRKQKSQLLGIIIPETMNDFFSTAMSGIQKVVSPLGYNVIAMQSAESTVVEQKNVQILVNTHVDGILASLASNTSNLSHFDAVIERGIPLVFFDRIPQYSRTATVSIDNYEATSQLTEHVIKQGCKTLTFFSGPPELHISRRRLDGFRDTCQRHNISDFSVIEAKYGQSDNISDLMQHLNLSKLPDGIIAINDKSALEMISKMRTKGIKVPDDLLIAGYNNDFYTSLTEPTITTVGISSYEIGKAAAEMLIEMLRGNIAVSNRILPHELIIRASTTCK